MQPPPIRIDVSQRTVLGFNYRQITILTIAGFLALAAFAGLKAAPLFVRGALPVLLTGLGVALAFGEINGKTPEAWLLDWLAFGRRPRYLLHRAIREKDARRLVLPDDGEPAEAAEVKSPAAQVKATSPTRSFFLLSANAIALALIVGLTLYLSDGGAERLIRMWWGL
jgi:hypothetical protein